MSEFIFRKRKWCLLKDKKVYGTPVFDLHEKEAAPEKNSDAGKFYVLKAPEWINIMAFTADGRIILVEQYRHGTGDVTLEIPGGIVDPGEHPRTSAERELREETGHTAGSWSYLGKTSANPAIMNNYTHLFLATECRKTGSPDTGEFEDIGVHLMEPGRFYDCIRDGTVHHAIVLAAVTRFLLSTSGNL
ncbi:MAG: NUDIX hydrolase [Balneolaceae bacterium]